MKTKHRVSEFLICAALAASAMMPRIWHLAETWHVDVARGGDAGEYEDLAWSIASTGHFQHTFDDPLRLGPAGTPTAHRTPGFPVFVAAIYTLLGRHVAAVRCAQVLLSTLSVLLLYVACRDSFGRVVGLVAASCWALWPMSVLSYYSSDSYYSETLAVTLLILSLWALSCVKKLAGPVLSGVFLGFALLTRGHLFLVVPILGLSAWVWRRDLGKGAARLGIAAIVAALPMCAWSVRNYLVLGTLSPSTQGGHAIWLGNNVEARGSSRADWRETAALRHLIAGHPELSGASETAKSTIYMEAAVQGIRERGWRHFLWLESRKAILFFHPGDATYGFMWWLVPILLLNVPGVVLAWRQFFGEQTLFLAATIASPAVTTLIYFHESRYRYLAEPALVVFASLAGVLLWRAALRPRITVPRALDSPGDRNATS